MGEVIKKVIVTGGSGKAGRVVLQDLIEHGYQAHNVDLVPPRDTAVDFSLVELTDTVMKKTIRELMAEVFPGVPIADGTGDFDTLLSIEKARRMLGYVPKYSWRQYV